MKADVAPCVLDVFACIFTIINITGDVSVVFTAHFYYPCTAQKIHSCRFDLATLKITVSC